MQSARKQYVQKPPAAQNVQLSSVKYNNSGRFQPVR